MANLQNKISYLTSTGHHGHNNRGACGGALDQHGEHHPDHQPHHRVRQKLIVLEDRTWKRRRIILHRYQIIF